MIRPLALALLGLALSGCGGGEDPVGPSGAGSGAGVGRNISVNAAV